MHVSRHCERSEAIHLAAQRKNGLLRFARNDGERPRRTGSPAARGMTKGVTAMTTSASRQTDPTINPAVTTFVYPLPTISRAPRAYVWRVSCHVAFQYPGLGRAV